MLKNKLKGFVATTILFVAFLASTLTTQPVAAASGPGNGGGGGNGSGGVNINDCYDMFSECWFWGCYHINYCPTCACVQTDGGLDGGTCEEPY